MRLRQNTARSRRRQRARCCRSSTQAPESADRGCDWPDSWRAGIRNLLRRQSSKPKSYCCHGSGEPERAGSFNYTGSNSFTRAAEFTLTFTVSFAISKDCREQRLNRTLARYERSRFDEWTRNGKPAGWQTRNSAGERRKNRSG